MEQDKNNKKPKFSMSWIYMLVLFGLMGMYFLGGDAVGGSASRKVSYDEFKTYVNKGYASKIVINKDESTLKMYVNPQNIRDVFKQGAKNTGKSPFVTTEFGSVDKVETFVEAEKKAGKFKGELNYENKRGNDLFNILLSFGPILLFIFLWLYFMRRMGGGGSGGAGGVFNVGKSKAKMYEKGTDINVTFKDVAGQAGAKQEVQEIVDFLKNPKKYTDLGGKIPKGALLVGPPGTGKTLLAKAVAGEAGVPFFSMSGSDFVEMFVGVGASRVRDLFRQAKEKSPCIIFIDEIDAVGRARSKNPAMGGNDERENTLNALLTEMDGFGTNSGVIILAATNQTPGFSGADIANVCNEAALIAARHNKSHVGRQDFLDAVDRIIGGLEKKTKVMTEGERRTIALHEAGHATISWFLEHANPLVKVSIVPRGRALGAAWYMPEERQITTKEEMLDEMCATLGGRAAEEMFVGHISTGAMNDLERVTKSAYGMIAYAGMSDRLPNICYYNNNEYNFQKPYSETTAKIMDDEVLKMINEQYQRAKNLLNEHKEGHNRLAELLLEREVIFAEDVEKIFGKRPWISRSEEIMESQGANKADDEAQASIKDKNQPAEDSDVKDENGGKAGVSTGDEKV